MKSTYTLLIFFLTFLFSCSDTTEKDSSQKKEVVEKEETTSKEKKTQEKVIMFFGNSLTAGYGLDPSESFPALIQDKIDSLGYDYKVINAGLSGETTAGGKSRISWVLKRQPVDVFVLELGANDGLRGVKVEETKENLKAIIDTVKSTYPQAKIILAGMMVPPNLGQDYSQKFAKIYPEIAKEENVALVPFLLEDVAGEEELNQNDGIHPTAEGQKIVAENVWDVLKKKIQKERTSEKS